MGSRRSRPSFNDILNRFPSDDFNEARLSRLNDNTPESSQWVFKSDAYREWECGRQPTLLCVDGPASRSSIWASAVFKRLSRESNIVAALFCSCKHASSSAAHVLLASILRQLAGHIRGPDSDWSLGRTTPDETNANDDDLHLIMSCLEVEVFPRFEKEKPARTVYLVLDGLDQYKVACLDVLMNELHSIQSKFSLKIFATSGYAVPSMGILKPYHILLFETIEISKCITQHLENLPDNVILDKGKLCQGIINASEGVLTVADRLASLVGEMKNEPAIRRFLKSWTKERKAALDAVFKEPVERLKSGPTVSLVRETMEWVAFSKRPLRLQELQHALVADIFEELETLPNFQLIFESTGGLLQHHEGTDIVRFAHTSMPDYIRGTYGTTSNVHRMMTNRCMAQLSHRSPRSNFCHFHDDSQQGLACNQFFEYAACNWGYHAQACEKLLIGVEDFLNDETKIQASCRAILAAGFSKEAGLRKRAVEKVNAWHLVAYFGLEHAIDSLLETKIQPIEWDGEASNMAVWWAIKNNQYDFLRILCDKVTYVLPALAELGYRDVVKLLLEAKCNPDAGSDEKCTALHLAIGKRHYGIAKDLLLAGANPNIWSNDKSTPIEKALGSRDFRAVRMLAAHGALMNRVSPKAVRSILSELRSADALVICENKKGGIRFNYPCEKKQQKKLMSGSKRYSVQLEGDKDMHSWILDPASHQWLRVARHSRPFCVETLHPGTIEDEEVDRCYDFGIAISLPNNDLRALRQDERELICLHWTAALDLEANPPIYESIAHVTTMGHIWLPRGGAEFLSVFVLNVKSKWLSLCDRSLWMTNVEHRNDVIEERGKKESLLDDLLIDGRTWGHRQEDLKNAVREIRGFAKLWCSITGNRDDLPGLQKDIDRLHQQVGAKLQELNDITRNLIEMEFNLVSIHEARQSVDMSISMKRLSWITFIFLPLTFVAGLFGMNIDILASNPSWRLYAYFATRTILITSTVWLVFKYTDLEKRIANTADRMETVPRSAVERIRGWRLVTFLRSAVEKVKGWREKKHESSNASEYSGHEDGSGDRSRGDSIV